MRRRSLLAVAVAGAALLGGGCDDRSTEAVDGPRTEEGRSAGPAAPERRPPAARTWVDLIAEADRAHVRRGGPVIDPGGPGWRSAARLGGSGGWLPLRTLDGRTVAYPDGIGASLEFPVGEEGPALRELVLWMRPLAPGQRVSLFIDEKPFPTIEVRPGGHEYRLRLPVDGLKPGEHNLRFWFRFTRYLGRERTPAAVDDVRLLPEGEAPALPDRWTGELTVAGRGGPALLAGPPVGWSFYVFLPPGARLRARPAVVEGGPVDFLVRIEADGEPRREVARTTVSAGSYADLDVDLDPWSGRPVRLSLETLGAAAPVPGAGWLEPVVVAPAPPAARVPPVRNVLVWVVDGLRDDRVGLGRGGERAATPNIDLLAAEGAAAFGVWSGAGRPVDGHRRLLRPVADGPSLPALMARAGRVTGYISASTGTTEREDLTADFQSGIELRRAGEPPDSRTVLRELDAWLDARRSRPFFLYVATDDPRAPLEPPSGYAEMYARARPPRAGEEERRDGRRRRRLRNAYDALVSSADYWVGQAVATLAAHGVLDDTAVIVVGSVGQELGERGGLGDGHALVPELLTVPLVVWHPALRDPGGDGRRVPVAGGDLTDVGATALALVGAEPSETWPGRSLLAALFEGRAPLPRPGRARLGAQAAGRWGAWLLHSAGGRELRLWNVARDPGLHDDLSATHPIAVRVLRDALLGEPDEP